MNIPDVLLESDNSKENCVSEKSFLDTEDSKVSIQPENYNSQLKPLGDITIELEDIIPCMYFKYLHLNIS